MSLGFIRKGIVLATLTCAVLLPGEQALAAEAKGIFSLQKIQIEDVLNVEYLANPAMKIEQRVEEVRGRYYDMVFAQVEEGNFIYIRSEAAEESEWLGKLYNEGAGKVIETTDEWTKIESGNVSGYVKTEDIVIKKEADLKAKEILAAKNPGVDVNFLDQETVNNSFSYAESKEEEAARLVEEAVRLEKEDAERRQGVVDFAMQFVGNPYVWGGTSLTNGADCSGFVKSIYANYGFSLPHSSRGMRNVGTEVSYSDVKPGDIICYEGHVGIYAGNGQIVNAIDDAHGIGVSSATYTDIITVRRMF